MSQESSDVPAGLRTVADLDLKPALEAVLMVVHEPRPRSTSRRSWSGPNGRSRTRCGSWPTSTPSQGRGFELRLIAGGWRFYTRPEYAAAVERFVLDGQQAGSPRRLLRPWRSSPTASRSADRGSRRSAE